MINPFLIERDDSEVIGKYQELLLKIESSIKDKTKKIIILLGDFGSGKSLILHKIESFLKNSNIEIYKPDASKIIKDLKEAPKKKIKYSILIDNIDFFAEIKETPLNSVVDYLEELNNAGKIIILSLMQDTLSSLLKIKPSLAERIEIYKMPSLSFSEAKKMVEGRIALLGEEAKEVKSFSDKEIMDIWDKSNGNPKMILLFCSYLFETKMKQGMLFSNNNEKTPELKSLESKPPAFKSKFVVKKTEKIKKNKADTKRKTKKPKKKSR